jgi:L-amino acid N-acyltransferase YncA
MASKPTWVIRPAKEDDFAFILDSWLKSTRDEPWAGVVCNNMAMAVLQETVRQLMLRGMKVSVAVNPERDEQIVGWLASEPGRPPEVIVHAIYVKQPFRRMGTAKQLLATVGLSPSDPFPYTYRSRLSRAFPNAKHLPGIARRHKV